jgi:hypothetical protein
MTGEVRAEGGLEPMGDSLGLGGFVEVRVSIGMAGNGDGCGAMEGSLEPCTGPFCRLVTPGSGGVLLGEPAVMLPLGNLFELEPSFEEV